MITKRTLILVISMFSVGIYAQQENPTKEFWSRLQTHCNKAYEGALILPKEDKAFGGKKLTMHVRSCTDSVIKIPFFVGDDRSRTWIFTYVNNRITLKHDHRHEDGTEDKINFYGGTTTNKGKADIQFFPADAHTQKMIPAAATNVWWVTLSDRIFSYNLKRLGTDRIFKVEMNLDKTIPTPEAPWGWKD